ncbi:MAG TPA: hypothetical protein VER12_04060 [Polyangiaceae bacterium]|nr:hypothetical protein [Polyangiaceae bacterium]
MMKSIDRWGSLAGGARRLLLVLVCFGAGGCGDGGDTEACPGYACVTDVHLDGSVTLESDLAGVDVQFCIEGTCKRGAFERQALATEPCLRLDNNGSKVCLSESAASDTFELTSTMFYDYGGDPHDVTVELSITDRTSGEVLLDETRIAKSRVTHEDVCHRCWVAEAAL